MADYSIALQGRPVDLTPVDFMKNYGDIQSALEAQRKLRARQALSKEFSRENINYPAAAGAATTISPELGFNVAQQPMQDYFKAWEQRRLEEKARLDAESERARIKAEQSKSTALSTDERAQIASVLSQSTPENYAGLRESLVQSMPKAALATPLQYIPSFIESMKTINIGGAKGIASESRAESSEQRSQESHSLEQKVRQQSLNIRREEEAASAEKLKTYQKEGGKFVRIPDVYAEPVNKIINKYDSLKDKYNEAQIAANQLVELARSGDSGANTVATISSFAKLLDPGGVVRDQDFANAQKSSSLIAGLVNRLKSVASGMTLDDTSRKAMVVIAGQVLDEYNRVLQESRDTYEKRLAFISGDLPVDDILGTMKQLTLAQGKEQQQSQSADQPRLVRRTK